MRYRLVCAVSALVLTGCFEDPPSAPGGSGDASSTADAGSTMAGTTAPGETSNGDETSVADASSSGSSGGTCELFPVDPGGVPADIVVLIDDMTPVDMLGPVIDELQSVGPNNIALLAPEAALAELEFDSDCPLGCGLDSCSDDATRITVPYNGNGYDALVELETFDCVFRESTSSSAHLYFITSTPEEMPPMNLGDLVLKGEVPLRVHLACPGCDPELLVANNLLAQVVWDSGGSVANTMMPASVAAQAGLVGAPRISCVWPAPFPPVFYLFEPEGDFADIDPLFAGQGFELSDCDFEDVENGEGVFVEVEEGVIFLCPETCSAVQAFPANTIAVSECI